MSYSASHNGKPFRNIDEVLRQVSKVDEGGELVDLARRKDCVFVYDDTGTHLSSNQGAVKYLVYNPQHFKMLPVIFLNPLFPLEDQVLAAGHELHHIWQDFQAKPIGNLSHPDGKPKVMLGLGLQRILEGATHTFHVGFADKLRRTTGLPVPCTNDPAKDSLTLFNEFQRNAAVRVAYDATLVKEYERIITGIGPQEASTAFNLSSFDAAGDMRRVARTGLKPDSAIYLPHTDNRELFLDVLSHVDSSVKARARALTP